MRIEHWILMAALAGTVPLGAAGALAEPDNHRMVAPEDIKWGPGPKSLPPGAEAAILYGDPAKDGLFAMRLKLPKGYHVPPHTHPRPEVVTVISGRASLGMGETADKTAAHDMASGGFMSMPPGTAHYVYVDEPTIVQLNSTGPWDIIYVEPKDDPRQSATQ